MPRYLSTHIIACLTRQALAQLISTLQGAQEVTLVWAGASQMAGRLVCEFDAPDQDTLLTFLDEHLVAHEWIIRIELAWGDRTTATGAAQSTESAPSAAAGGERVASAETEPQRASEGPPGEDEAVVPRPSMHPLPRPIEAKILHILRALKDESAWQFIATQHQAQPVAVLLIHDAVLAPPPLDVPMFACEADVLARGTSSPFPLLTYDQIVELVFAAERVVVW